jgi:hypothetical protein
MAAVAVGADAGVVGHTTVTHPSDEHVSRHGCSCACLPHHGATAATEYCCCAQLGERRCFNYSKAHSWARAFCIAAVHS